MSRNVPEWAFAPQDTLDRLLVGRATEGDQMFAVNALNYFYERLKADAAIREAPPPPAAPSENRVKREAPWVDFIGQRIREGDVIKHPSGETGTVVFLAAEKCLSDQWRVDYGSGSPLSRLVLQIGDKGRAVVSDFCLQSSESQPGDTMKITRFENGMTVAELKALIADWPVTHADGTPCEVWLGDGRGYTNQAREIMPLGLRIDRGPLTADLLLNHDGDT